MISLQQTELSDSLILGGLIVVAREYVQHHQKQLRCTELSIRIFLCYLLNINNLLKTTMRPNLDVTCVDVIVPFKNACFILGI